MSALEAPAPPRSPWQLLYGAAHAARRRWYRSRARRLPRPVVSVGNLHWGGAGKTPLVAAVAGHLRDRGLAVAVLSRGYGGGGGRGARMVSTGDGPLLDAAAAGDEPVLLAAELPGVPVVVGADRHAAGRHALDHLPAPPEIFVLDDAFSHLALERDLDLLAFPAADPFAGGRLAPAGRLREPLAAARRADAVLLTGEAPEGSGAALAEALRPHGYRGPGFAAPTVAGAPRPVEGAGDDLPSGTPVLLVSGIARPERFHASAAAAGLDARATLAYPDHHPYPEATLREIATAFREADARAVVVTAKDGVKLAGRLDLPLYELPVRAEPEPTFWSWLDDRLGRLLPDQPPSAR